MPRLFEPPLITAYKALLAVKVSSPGKTVPSLLSNTSFTPSKVTVGLKFMVFVVAFGALFAARGA